uniref:Protein-tyrosine-phosphatase n=1 Tax=Anopheles atroparvus TaxID=41427 RepID=A0AAG5DMF3_ANOAO
MVKIKLLFHLWLGVVCLFSQESRALRAAVEDESARNQIETGKNTLNSPAAAWYEPPICSLVNVRITVTKKLNLLVPEWSGEDSNLACEVSVTWVDWNKRNRKHEQRSISAVKIANLQGYTLPVKDICNIVRLEVCKTDRITHECVCGIWGPTFIKIKVSKKDESYLVRWKMEPSCANSYAEQYIIKYGSGEAQTSVPFVALNHLMPCKWHQFELRAIRNNSIAVRKAFQLFAYPSASIFKCTVNVLVEDVEAPFVTESNDASIQTAWSASERNRLLNNSLDCTLTNENNIPDSCNIPLNTTDRKRVDSRLAASLPKCFGPSCSPPRMCPIGADNSVEATVKPQAISPVRDLRANTDLQGTVILTWRPPVDGKDCIKQYLITWASESITIDAVTTFYHVTDLEACMTYNFTVNTIDQGNDKGTPATIAATVRVLEQLSEVTELELYEVEPRSLTAKWKPPTNGSYCVKSYRLVAWYDDPQTAEPMTVFSNTTEDLHVTFGEVIACMTYTVQVIPISITNKDGRNEIGSLKTKERTILSYHVEPIRALSVRSRSLQLSTQLLSENNNNCLLVSVRFSCNILLEGEIDPETEIVKEFVTQSETPSFEGIMEPLKPFATYHCTAQIQNIAGWSDPTPAYEFQTAEDVPEMPSVMQLTADSDSILVAWKAPTVKNGVVVRYRINVRMIQQQYPIPKSCDPVEEYNETVDLRDEIDPEAVRSWNGAEFEYTISKLAPFTLYSVQVAAATGAGVGPYTEPNDVVTRPDVPEPAQNFIIAQVEGPVLEEAYRSAVTLSWQLPCRLHGNLTRFVGRLYGVREDGGLLLWSHELTWNVTVDSDEINDTYSYIEDRLRPEYNYTVSMSVEVANINERSPETSVSFQSPAGIPAIDETEKFIDVNVLDAPNPTNTARIVLGKINLTADIGSIRYMALLISERGCQGDPEPRTDLMNITGTVQWPEVLDWHRVINMRCIAQYQTTPEFWNPMVATPRADAPIEYVVGREQCDDGKKYCNGPLKPGTEYALIVRVFSRSGYTDSPIQSFRTDSLIQVGLIISTVVASLLLAFIGGLLVLWRKQRLLLPTQLSGRTPTEEPSDIPLKNFPHQYDELFQSNREKVGKEFQAINYFSDSVLMETVSFLSARENEQKNRYVNILPFDSNRVLLDAEEHAESIANDYINASFIEGYKYQREYIATQGPKPNTCYDFWWMMLQYEIESIVMLTQPIDHDKNKCCQYYPLFNQSVEYGDIQVKCTQEMNLSLYYKRLFIVSKGNQSKAVFHYHFLNWPDHSCPSSPADLIKFSKIIRSERKSYAIPLVVHCSAGVGRTGTFIALDIILQRMQQEKKINVYDTVKRLRRQRVKMVQTLDQYAFLYQCCLEYVSKINRKKPKTSSVEVIGRGDTERRSPDVVMEVDNVAVSNGDKPMFNIKFPKSVNPGLAGVTSFAPTDIESGKW